MRKNTQHVHSPTRDANLLNVVAADSTLTLFNAEVSDAGLASGHRLVTAKIGLRPPAQPRPSCEVPPHRQHQRIDEFQSALRRSSLYTKPASTADEFACSQLAYVVVSELNAVALVKTVTLSPTVEEVNQVAVDLQKPSQPNITVVGLSALGALVVSTIFAQYFSLIKLIP